jgi:hypothetical protein
MIGVEYNEKTKKWRAYIDVGGRKKYLGSFDTEYEAGMAYDMHILKQFRNATVNFPESKKLFK